MSDNASKPFKVYITEDITRDGEPSQLRTRIGSAFPHSKGGGFNIVIRNGISVTGKLVMFPPDDRDDEAE